MGAPEIYAKEILDNFKRYATWLPDQRIAVGTVGQLQDNIFTPISELRHFNIPFNMVKDPSSQSAYKFMSKGTTEIPVSTFASGIPTPAGGITAALNVSFSREHSVYFSLAKCVGSAIDNLVGLGNNILRKLQQHHWKMDYVVVTGVVEAGSATIMQAESKGASFELKGDTSGIPVEDLMKAGGSVKVGSQKMVGINIVAQNKLTPLLRLAGVKSTMLKRILRGPPEFSPNLGRNMISLNQFNAHIMNTPNISLLGEGAGNGGALLNVRLPRYGNYVDIGDLVNFTVEDLSLPSDHLRGTRVASPISFHPSTRIHQKQLKAIVDELRDVEIGKVGLVKDFVPLKLTLKKSGGKVSVAPLVQLATKATQPQAHLNVNAELSFRELQ